MSKEFISLESALRIETSNEAIGDIIDYIELFHNQKPRHAKLGNISSGQYDLKKVKRA